LEGRVAFYVYMVMNPTTGALYIGHTDDISRRAHEHRHGLLPGWSRDHACKKLVWYAEFESRDAAKQREWQMKKWKRDWKLRQIEEDNPDGADLYERLNW